MKAVLEGACKVCDRHISIGDSIDKTPDGWWVHTECADLLERKLNENY